MNTRLRKSKDKVYYDEDNFPEEEYFRRYPLTKFEIFLIRLFYVAIFLMVVAEVYFATHLFKKFIEWYFNQ